MSSIRVKFVSKKINRVKWRPQSASVFVTGSWDDKENQICVWSYPNTSLPVHMMEDDSFYINQDPQVIAEAPFPGDVTDLKVVSDELMFASSSLGSVHVFKYTNEKLIQHHVWNEVHSFLNGPAPATAISVKGNDIASVGEDGRLCIQNFIKLQNVRQIESSDVCCFTTVSYLRHQEIVVGNILGHLKVWDLKSGSTQPSHTLLAPGERIGITCMNLHPTQPHVLASGHEDGTLCIWDLRQERRPATVLEGHCAPVTDLLFHPLNPDILFTSSMDGSVWQWNSSALKTSGSSIPAEQDINFAAGNPWLNCDASKHRLEITSLDPQNTSCVNSLDINDKVLVWGTDNEALYILDV